MFSQEGDSAEGGQSWFTHKNLDSEENSMVGLLAGFTTPSIGGVALNILEKIITKAAPKFAEAWPGISGGAAIADIFGTIGLVLMVDTITQQQKADVLT